MTRVKTNFFANLAGSGWTALVGLACTPLYIRFVGMESYGLIGFYFMLQGVIQILDLGLSPTVNREVARYSVLPGKRGISSGRCPMFNTVFPRFSSLVAAGDEKSLLEMYHGSTQVMAVMILPAAVIAFFSRKIMLLWTGSLEIAGNTAPIVSILVAGTALNGLMNLPYALQLSHGWTRIST